MQRAPEPNGLRGTIWCTSSPLLLLRRLAGLAEPAVRRALLARGLAPALRRLPRLLLLLRIALPLGGPPPPPPAAPRAGAGGAGGGAPPAGGGGPPAAGGVRPARLAVARLLAVTLRRLSRL